MPQSLSRVVIHLIFSTKNRDPKLTMDRREKVFAYLAGILKNHSCVAIQVGGFDDHVHVLCALSRTVTIASLVEHLKTGSTKYVKAEFGIEFAWQTGYAVYAVSESHVPAAAAYIANQDEHHRRLSFQEELRELLSIAGIPFDERYVWD